MKTITDIKFVCPKCGSQRWGHRSCNRTGCGFSWDRKDDWKYFKQITIGSFESEEDFLLHQDVI